MYKTLFDDPAISEALERIKKSEEYSRSNYISEIPENTALAMAYVPIQLYRKNYGIDEGFSAGTAFPELDKPFLRGNTNE